MVENVNSPSCAVQDIVLGHNQIESLGVDEEEGYVVDEEDETVIVPSTNRRTIWYYTEYSSNLQC